MSEWQPIETAPKDCNILVWFDHGADTYQDPNDPRRLTDYAAWAEGGPFMDGSGHCIAKWQEEFWDATDEYGGGYLLPAYWFAFQNDDGEFVDHDGNSPWRAEDYTHWMPLPAPPVQP